MRRDGGCVVMDFVLARCNGTRRAYRRFDVLVSMHGGGGGFRSKNVRERKSRARTKTSTIDPGCRRSEAASRGFRPVSISNAARRLDGHDR